MARGYTDDAYNIDENFRSKMSNIIKWVSFYREYIDVFIEDYIGVKLKLFQKIILVMMDRNLYFLFLAARGLGKSFLISLFCVARCILYPGTKIIVASGSRKQANVVLEKIMS